MLNEKTKDKTDSDYLIYYIGMSYTLQVVYEANRLPEVQRAWQLAARKAEVALRGIAERH